MFELFDPLRKLKRHFERLEKLTRLEASVLVGKRKDVIELTSDILSRMKKQLEVIQRFYYQRKAQLQKKLGEDEFYRLGAGIQSIAAHYHDIIYEFERDEKDIRDLLHAGGSDAAFASKQLNDLFKGVSTEIAECDVLLKRIKEACAKEQSRLVAEVYVHDEYVKELSRLDSQRRSRVEAEVVPILIDALRENKWNPGMTVIAYSGRSYNLFYMERTRSGPYTISIDQWYRLYWYIEGKEVKRLYLCDIWGTRAPKNHMHFGRSIGYYRSSTRWHLVQRVAA